jgi:dinuclear metal center YbgI/SA1388 family protein
VKLESLLQYVDGYLGVATHPDYPTALNGLQVEGRSEVEHLCAAVDASEAAIEEAASRGADLLLVHHGLFWDGLRPVTGKRYRKLARLVSEGVGLYSVHLPLDSHPDVGNCALLARRLGLDIQGRFGSYKGADLGWWGTVDSDREDFRAVVEAAVDGPVRLIPGGPERVGRVGVVTGGAGSMLADAVAAGLDAYVTGEGSHHTWVDAHEDGINLYYAGHYATETFGVRALAEHLAGTFGLTWEFIDLPSGM